MVREIQKSLRTFTGFWCCRSAKMNVVARIPASGFVPGQTIDLQIDVDNQSDERCTFSCELLMVSVRICFFFILPNEFPRQLIINRCNSGAQQLETIALCVKDCIGIAEGKKANLFRESLLIPPVPPTDVTTCSVCQVQYALRISFEAACRPRNVLVEFPITIGTIPIVYVSTSANQVMASSSQESVLHVTSLRQKNGRVQVEFILTFCPGRAE